MKQRLLLTVLLAAVMCLPPAAVSARVMPKQHIQIQPIIRSPVAAVATHGTDFPLRRLHAATTDCATAFSSGSDSISGQVLDIGLGTLSLVYAAVLNGVAAVPLLFLILNIAGNEKIMGEYKSGILSNIFVWATVFRPWS